MGTLVEDIAGVGPGVSRRSEVLAMDVILAPGIATTDIHARNGDRPSHTPSPGHLDWNHTDWPHFCHTSGGHASCFVGCSLSSKESHISGAPLPSNQNVLPPCRDLMGPVQTYLLGAESGMFHG